MLMGIHLLGSQLHIMHCTKLSGFCMPKNLPLRALIQWWHYTRKRSLVTAKWNLCSWQVSASGTTFYNILSHSGSIHTQMLPVIPRHCLREVLRHGYWGRITGFRLLAVCLPLQEGMCAQTWICLIAYLNEVVVSGIMKRMPPSPCLDAHKQGSLVSLPLQGWNCFLPTFPLKSKHTVCMTGLLKGCRFLSVSRWLSIF